MPKFKNLAEMLQGKKDIEKDLTAEKLRLKMYKNQSDSLTKEEELDAMLKSITESSDKISGLEKDLKEIDFQISEAEKKSQELGEEIHKSHVDEINVNQDKTKGYLDSPEAVSKYLEFVKTSTNAREAADKWKSYLSSEKGISKGVKIDSKLKGVSGLSSLLPTPVITSITNSDLLLSDENVAIVNSAMETGTDAFPRAVDTATGDTTKAHIWDSTSTTAKIDETVTLTGDVIRAAFVYKHILLPREFERPQYNGTALLNYLFQEMPQRIYELIAKAMVIGADGAGGTTEFIPMVAAAEATAGRTKKYTATDNSLIYENTINTILQVLAPGSLHLVMSKATYGQLKLAKDGAGHYMFSQSDLATSLGVKAIHTPAWMGNYATNPIIAYAEGAYKLTGDSTIEQLIESALSLNSTRQVFEIYKGGALEPMASCGILVPATSQA